MAYPRLMLPLAVLTAACLAGAGLGHLIIDIGPLPGFWPPAGVLVAALLTRGRREWPAAIGVASAVTWLSLAIAGQPPLTAVIAAALVALDALLVVGLVRRLAKDEFSLDRLTHAAVLLMAAVTAPLAGAVIASAVLPAAGAALESLRSWWLAEAVGIVVTAPLALAVTHAYRTHAWPRGGRAVEAAIVLAACVATAEAIFSDVAPPIVRVPAFILPFFLWPAIRLGLVATSATTFTVAFEVLWHASRGEGPLALLATSVLLRTQAGILIAAGSVLLLASIVSERRRIAQERDLLVIELQQALAEIKTLRGFIPICAWCHKVRDDAGFWQEIEHYLDERTDATFSHGICPGCVEEQHRDITEQIASPS